MALENSRTDIVEKGGPNNRYYRFSEKLGSGAYKKVWLAYDSDTGNEVAWNTVKLSQLPGREKKRIQLETLILRNLQHPNIIHFYHVWENTEKDEVIFTTELISSGTLKQYIQKVKNVKLKVIKRWCREILNGLNYLHSHNPPIIHRDIKCDNIFINGNTGEILIGDLGLCTMRNKTHVKSVLGTPEFMAPELYDENYTEKVDIYAFGMCVLEMITNQYPYEECTYATQIYKKVTMGEKPLALETILDTYVKEFISICLSPEKTRLSAIELLRHPFLCYKGTNPSDNYICSVLPSNIEKKPEKKVESLVDRIPNKFILDETQPKIDKDEKINKPRKNKNVVTCTMAKGKEADPGFTSLSLIINLDGKKKEIKFRFGFLHDSPEMVAEEMVNELGLDIDKKSLISDSINNCIEIPRKEYLQFHNLQDSKKLPSIQLTKQQKNSNPNKESHVSFKELSPSTREPSNSITGISEEKKIHLVKEYFKNTKIKDLKNYIKRYNGDSDSCSEKDELITELFKVAPYDIKKAWISSSFQMKTDSVNDITSPPPDDISNQKTHRVPAIIEDAMNTSIDPIENDINSHKGFKTVSTPEDPQTSPNHHFITGISEEKKIHLVKEYFKNTKIKDLKNYIKRYNGDSDSCSEKDELITELFKVAPYDIKKAWISSSFQMKTDSVNDITSPPLDTHHRVPAIIEDAINTEDAIKTTVHPINNQDINQSSTFSPLSSKNHNDPTSPDHTPFISSNSDNKLTETQISNDFYSNSTSLNKNVDINSQNTPQIIIPPPLDVESNQKIFNSISSNSNPPPTHPSQQQPTSKHNSEIFSHPLSFQPITSKNNNACSRTSTATPEQQELLGKKLMALEKLQNQKKKEEEENLQIYLDKQARIQQKYKDEEVLKEEIKRISNTPNHDSILSNPLSPPSQYHQHKHSNTINQTPVSGPLSPTFQDDSIGKDEIIKKKNQEKILRKTQQQKEAEQEEKNLLFSILENVKTEM